MSMKLKPYPEYRDSGLPWLGKIPAHWDERRAKYFFREVDERSRIGQEELLSVSHVTGVSPRSQKNVTMFMAESYVGHKLCHAGDLVINTMWAWMAALGVARQTGIISPSYAVYRPIHPNALLPDFVDHLLRTKPYVAEYVCRSTGIRSSRLRLYPEECLKIPIACPPTDEQEQMVAYLKAKDHRIRRLIRAKRRMIELLNEQKQAIIHRAVTRGLDPNVRLKPSGIDWLGDVPEHWLVKPLKRWARISGRVLLETTDEDFEFRYLDIGAVGTGFLMEPPERMRFADAPSRARRILKKGDTIISTVRTYLKAVYFVSEDADDLIASTGFAVLTPCSGIVPEYLSFVIQSSSFVERVTAHSVGIAYPAIPETRLGAFHLVLPPTELEQLEIVERINEETQAMNKAIQRAQREIELVREYRSRLIADVVTGKLDVRGVELPDLDEDEVPEEWDAGEEEGAYEVAEAEEMAGADV